LVCCGELGIKSRDERRRPGREMVAATEEGDDGVVTIGGDLLGDPKPWKTNEIVINLMKNG
jgi:hypothetical protein